MPIHHRTKWRRVVMVCCAAALMTPAASAAQASVPGPIVEPTGRTAVADYVPLWSIPTTADGAAVADLGAAAPQAPMAARVYLTGKDPAGLIAYATAVSTPGSPL